MRCCLGQVSQQCGITDKQVMRKSSPSDLSERARKKLPAWLCASTTNSKPCFAAMETNDNRAMSDAERETKIAAIFSAHGDELEFIP